MSKLRSLLFLVVAALVAALAVNVIEAPAATAAQPGMTVRPAVPIRGESVALSGRFSTRFKRAVQLQRKAGTSWVTVGKASTTAVGTYTFTGRKVWKATTFRALAPATKRGRHKYPRLLSPMKLVTPASQTATLQMLPQIAQPGPAVSYPANARSVMAAQFTPVRVGRPVALQLQSGSSWLQVGTGTQNAQGIAELTAPARVDGEVAVYRVVTNAAKGAPGIATAGARTDTWGDADFSDGFVGTSLGADWIQRGQDYNPAGGRKCSKGSPDAVAVGDGVVKLKVISDPTRTKKCSAYSADGTFIGRYNWRLNGHIATQQLHSFRYGFAAARIKFQSRRGQHGSFWMKPQTSVDAPGNPTLTGAEIDVTEWFGNGHPMGGMSSYAYYPGGDGKTVKVGSWIKDPARFLSSRTDGWATQFHVFSVEWTPTRYVFRIDGRETFRTSEGVSGQPEYLILSLLSSDYELGYLGDETRLPASMSVDWVRFWQA